MIICLLMVIFAPAALAESRLNEFWSDSPFNVPPAEHVTAEPWARIDQKLAIESYNFAYREPTLMNDTGLFNSIDYSISVRKGYMLAFDLRYSDGLVNYDGSTWNGIPLKINNIPDHCTEGRILGAIRSPFSGWRK